MSVEVDRRLGPYLEPDQQANERQWQQKGEDNVQGESSVKQGVAHRGRWSVGFALLLLALSAVPVFADPPPEDGSAYAPSESQLANLPSAEDTTKAIAEAKQREAEAKDQLETPAAEKERGESQEAFAGVSASEAEALLREEFSEQLALINSDPARMLTDAELDEVLGSTGARVTVEGESMLLEGSMPVRAANDEGELKKLDLNLAQEGNEYAPVNPLTEVSLPAEASEGVEVGPDSDSVVITPVMPEGDSTARRLGNKDLLYFETQQDTDLLASPLASGVELSSILRSADSPENLRFDVEVPAGSQLQADGEGGATLTGEDGAIHGIIPPPTAIDAQGASVPVQLEVENESIILHVPHREQEVAYPLYVDPLYENWSDNGFTWLNGYGLSALDPNGTWTWSTNNGGRLWGQTTPIYTRWGGSERGLFVSATSTSGWQYGGSTGQWTYEVPGGSTYITQAGFMPFLRENHNCGAAQYTIPLDFDGIYSPAQSRYLTFHLNDANNSGWTWNAPNLGDPSTYTGKILAMGLSTWEGGTAIPCWRDIYAGGAAVYLDDQESPTLTGVYNAPTSWVNGNQPLSIYVTAGDAGLGVKNVKIIDEGPPIRLTPEQSECTGLKQSRCLASVAGNINFTGAAFPEGESTATVVANDPMLKVSNQGSWTMKVDRTSPELNLSGQLATITNEAGTQEHEGDEKAPGEDDELSLPSYQLTIKATDGDATKKRSGVKNIEIYIDKKTEPESVPWSAQTCATYSCPMEETYTLNLTKLTPGAHTLKVVGVDQVGNKTTPERKVEFQYVPATGMTDEYVLHHIPLPDGKNHSEEEVSHGPELAVNVINGNLVYHEQDLDAPASGLELERFYNSQLPAEQNTEWGSGWSLSQAPDLKLEAKGSEESAPKGSVVDKTGAVSSEVALPKATEEESFEPKLQATIAKTAGGGYEVTDEKGGGTDLYGSEGQMLESRPDASPGEAPSKPVVAATTLCKNNAQRPECLTDDRYRSGSVLSASATEAKLETSLGNVVCGSSSLVAESSAEAGEPLPLSVSAWTISSCMLGTTSCSATTQNVPASASLKAITSGNGELKVGSGSKAPGWLLKCGTTLECTVSFEPTFTAEGSEQPHLVASKKTMSRSGAKCPTEAKFSANYTVSSPKPLYVEGLGFPANEPILRYSYTGSNLTKIAQAERAAEVRPAINLGVTSGLVASVSGAAGSSSYAYESGRLTAAQSPAGKTTYGYDASGRLTSIKLPNETTATIAYEATYGRVTSIKVDPAGPEGVQTTTFSYTDNPRETKVTPQSTPAISYKIAADGSVFKWQTVKLPPAFDSIAGTLWEHRNSTTPIPAGDQTLSAVAKAIEGAEIRSIEVIKDGNQLVAEKTCADNPETPEKECQSSLTLKWVTNTASMAPGYADLEVLAEDSLGQTVSEKFTDYIPYTPPPVPGVPTEPTYGETLHFREEFGLDLDLKGNEEAIESRVWKVLANWQLGDPVARSSMERWGVPLYPADVAELEYRERYVAADAEIITQWAETNAPNTFAGYWVDHRNGGLIRLGFTANQTQSVSELTQVAGLLATNRFVPFSSIPGHSYTELQSLQSSISANDATHLPLRGKIGRVGIDVKNNAVAVGTPAVQEVTNGLTAAYGGSAPFTVYYDPQLSQQSVAEHWTDEGPIRNGQAIGRYYPGTEIYSWCTAGVGAWEQVGTGKNGAAQYAQFVLTAGHCFPQGFNAERFHSKKDTKPEEFGFVARRSSDHPQDGFITDGEAIRIEDGSPVPRTIVGEGRSLSVNSAAVAKPGQIVCISGATTSRVPPCLPVLGPAEIEPGFEDEETGKWYGPYYVLHTNLLSNPGDSGAPVWISGTGEIVGLNSVGGSGTELFSPLLPPHLTEKGLVPWEQVKRDKAPGILNAPGMGALHIVTSNN
jgi:YD repeat-containing protein